jgi:hypothetical protein
MDRLHTSITNAPLALSAVAPDRCHPFPSLARRRRHSYNVDSILEETERWESWADAKRELFWMGTDAQGVPTLWLRGMHHHPGTS